MKPVDPQVLHKLETAAREMGRQIGRTLDSAMGEHYGFTLMLFSFDGAELTWISNGQREDMIKVMKEFVEKLENNTADELSRPKGRG